MPSTKALAYFRNDSKTRIVADAGPEGFMPQGICLTWSGVMHRRKRKRLLLCGLASGSIYM